MVHLPHNLPMYGKVPVHITANSDTTPDHPGPQQRRTIDDVGSLAFMPNEPKRPHVDRIVISWSNTLNVWCRSQSLQSLQIKINDDQVCTCLRQETLLISLLTSPLRISIYLTNYAIVNCYLHALQLCCIEDVIMIIVKIVC